jgi:hypothetical protein
MKAGGEHGYQYVYVHLKNSGALTTKPTGSLQIFDASGKRVAARDLQLDTFLPGTEIDYPVLLPERALDPGAYTACVKLTYGAAAIGYRRTAGAAQTIGRMVAFTVSKGQYTKVFSGAPPLRQRQSAAKGSTGSDILLVLVGALAGVLVLLLTAVGVAFHRWSAR